jgi:hypothetical protein
MTIRLAIICLLGGVVGHLLAKQAMGYIDSKSITDIKGRTELRLLQSLVPIKSTTARDAESIKFLCQCS